METMLIHSFKSLFTHWNSVKNGKHEENHNLKVQWYNRRDFFHCFREKKKKEVVREEEALNIDMLEYCHNLQS